MKFYLGTHRTNWLWDETFRDIPLFVSHRTLRGRKSPYPKAVTTWALDSGGFTELSMHGKWMTTEDEYIDKARGYMNQLGSLDWVSPQDYMCEPWITEKTGLSVDEHQKRTVENYLSLTSAAPDIPFIPVLQGWELDDYFKCVALYEKAGIDLTKMDTVGIGSVCRRQSTDDIEEIVKQLHGLSLQLHGFGVKGAGIGKYGPELKSADSMAWSLGGRRAGKNEDCPSKNVHCANCAHYAIGWRARTLARMI